MSRRGRRQRAGLALAAIGAALAVLAADCAVARAQAIPGLDPTGRSGDPPALGREEPKPAPAPVPLLPPLPPPAPGEPAPLLRERVFVREIRVLGSTVFTADELRAVTAPYVGRELDAEDLEAARLAVTLLYVNRGHVNSGAIIPDQTVREGVVVLQVIEGQLTRVEIQGNRWFRTGWLRDRLTRGAGPPLDVDALQQRIQLLLEDPRLRRLNAELRPGLQLGEGVLGVVVEERSPYRAALEFNNHQSPAVGAERGLVTLEHLNLTGNGDPLFLRYGRSPGADPQLDFRYALPFTRWDSTLALAYRRNDFTVVEAPFDELDIESESEIYGITLRQPVYRTVGQEVALELTGERLLNETSLLGEPFSLSPGARSGRSVVTALRIAQEWVHRTPVQVVAARSRFSFGLDALGATVNEDDRLPDGRFFAWLGQFQWVRRLGLLDIQTLLRADLQLAADPLLTLEQFAVGGRYTVRGYRENTLVRDNALVVGLEVRVPLVRGAAWADLLELAPFVDYGRGWNTRQETPDPVSIASAGIGLRWAVTIPAPVTIRPHLEVYWGHGFRDMPTSRRDLQDHGIHLLFAVTLS